MYYELSKRKKEIARACIDKGLEAEFREGLEKSASIIADWRDGKFSNLKEAIFNYTTQLTKKTMQSANDMMGWRVRVGW